MDKAMAKMGWKATGRTAEQAVAAANLDAKIEAGQNPDLDKMM
jgi:hypothetical protein